MRRGSNRAFRFHSLSNRAGWPARRFESIDHNRARWIGGSPVSCVWKKRFDGGRAHRISIGHRVARKLAPAHSGRMPPPLLPLVASSLLRPDRKLINRKAAIATSSITRSWLDPKIHNSIFIRHGLLKDPYMIRSCVRDVNVFKDFYITLIKYQYNSKFSKYLASFLLELFLI